MKDEGFVDTNGNIQQMYECMPEYGYDVEYHEDYKEVKNDKKGFLNK
jgi:hypothetical protein